MEFTQLKDRVKQEAANWRATAVLIEDHGSGTSLIQILQSDVRGIKGVTHDRDKVTRATIVTPLLEGGILRVPKDALCLAEFVEEYLAFPHPRHDDQVDALTQFLNWVGEKRRSIFDADFGRHDSPVVPSGVTFLRWPGR